ncbi:MAG TPA: amidohydrolase family protein, partial [bacterium]|nr:amidohydrolase family protein [bacterium]
LKMLSLIVSEHPERLKPFVMLDPRRSGSAELAIQCLERMDFCGVKIYPSLGYSPDPYDVLNDKHSSANLEAIYGYCEGHSIPITAHCSRGGAYGEHILPEHHIRDAYAHPRCWETVLKKHNRLILNLAHFGGDLGLVEDDSWSGAILEMMKDHPTLYADLSCNPQALERKSSVQYFKSLRRVLDDPLTRERILFGTDWFMLRHTWTESEIVRVFGELPKDDFEQITFRNPSAFLFPNSCRPR